MTRVRLILGLLLLSACQGVRTEAPVTKLDGGTCLLNARAPGGAGLELHMEDGRITWVGEPGQCAGPSLDAEGAHVVPGFIDSHVHLAYLPVGHELLRGGVVMAVDLAAPEPFLADRGPGPEVLAAGPMITAPAGYPTRSWGANGYGLECNGAESCVDAVRHLHDLGASVIKVPLTDAPTLDDEGLRAVVEVAHELDLPVAVHALGDAEVRRAGEAGADVLAHTPIELLSDESVALWSDRALITTLSAFAGGFTTENVARLQAAGTTLLYGTDLGNTGARGISASEINLMLRAGLSPRAILDTGTVAPARFWNRPSLGALRPGSDASFLLVDADPLLDPRVIATPAAVFHRGRRLE